MKRSLAFALALPLLVSIPGMAIAQSKASTKPTITKKAPASSRRADVGGLVLLDQTSGIVGIMVQKNLVALAFPSSKGAVALNVTASGFVPTASAVRFYYTTNDCTGQGWLPYADDLPLVGYVLGPYSVLPIRATRTLITALAYADVSDLTTVLANCKAGSTVLDAMYYTPPLVSQLGTPPFSIRPIP